MMDENMFVCCEIDEEEDYSDEFKEVVDNIIEYLEDALDVEFEEDECFLQAIDIDDWVNPELCVNRRKGVKQNQNYRWRQRPSPMPPNCRITLTQPDVKGGASRSS